MDIGKAIYKILNDNIAVNSMVAGRIAPNVMKQTSPFPFIIYDVFRSTPEGQKDSVALLDNYNIMVSGYTKTYSDASKLANYIRTALDRQIGLYNNVNIQAIDFDGYDDVFDDDSGSDGIYRKALNFKIRVLNSFNNIYSLDFDGVDDYVEINNGAAAINANTGAMSLWINLPTVDTTGSMISCNYSTTDAIRIIYHAYYNEFRAIYKGGGTSATASIDGSSIEGDGNWHHIAMTWNKSLDRITLYIDGASVATANSLTTISSAFNVGAIGNNGLSGSYYQGNIDEVSTWSIELTASDISDIYNNGVPYTLAPDTGLVGWWRMGDGNITGLSTAKFPTIPDESTNDNTGTMTNMTSADIEADVAE
tara:strand:- start:3713 stop:4807 length:1095 start_codon:yes stop_codon:yes gene_type:complete